MVKTNPYDLYLKPVYPIIQEFDNKKFPYLVFTEDSRAKKNLEEKEISHIDVKDYLSEINEDGFFIIKKALIKIEEYSKNNSEDIEIFVCRAILNNYFLRVMIESIRYVDFYSKIISKLKPISIFVMPDGTNISRIVCRLAKKMKIKTYTTIAAAVTANKRSITNHTCDFIGCYGNEALDAYKKMGFDKSRLLLTGNPYFDFIKKYSNKKNNNFKLKSNKEKPIVLVATSSIDKKEIEWMKKLSEICIALNSKLIIKLHPIIEIKDEYKKLEKEINCDSLKEIQKMDISELVSISSMVITDYSHVGVYAILFEKPMVVVNFTNEPFLVRYDKYGVALLAENNNELKNCIKNILQNSDTKSQLSKSREKYINYFNYKNDGFAASRFFELLTN